MLVTPTVKINTKRTKNMIGCHVSDVLFLYDETDDNFQYYASSAADEQDNNVFLFITNETKHFLTTHCQYDFAEVH